METWGSSQETLVFLLGLGIHPRHYRYGFERLAKRFRVVVPDLSFRTRLQLPSTPDEYLDLVTAIADELAPDAVWVGHSFGALLALMREGPAVALAPSVPAQVALPRMFGRAVRSQLREYFGFEGWFGVTYAAQVMVDYVGTAVTRPGTIFPSIASLNAPPEAFPPRAQNAVVYLCHRDEMYRAREYTAYLEARKEGVEVITLRDSHDWPITRPERLETRVGEACDRLANGSGLSSRK